MPTALSVLYLSHKYMVPDLIVPVLQYIIFNVNEDTVLPVLQNLLLYYRPPALPSAPSLDPAATCPPASPVPPNHMDLYDKVYFKFTCSVVYSHSKSLSHHHFCHNYILQSVC